MVVKGPELPSARLHWCHGNEHAYGNSQWGNFIRSEQPERKNGVSWEYRCWKTAPLVWLSLLEFLLIYMSEPEALCKMSFPPPWTPTPPLRFSVHYESAKRHHFANKGLYRSYDFSSSHVRMWELDHKEGWAPKSWCFKIIVLEKMPESPLDSKEIKGNQPWIFTEGLILKLNLQ